MTSKVAVEQPLGLDIHLKAERTGTLLRHLEDRDPLRLERTRSAARKVELRTMVVDHVGVRAMHRITS